MSNANEQWGVVELMGHVRIAGRISEEEKFGAKIGRLDIPQGDGFVTQFFGGGSVYRITFCSEEAARLVAKQSEPSPVHSWEMPRLTSQPASPVREPFMERDEIDEIDERDNDDMRPF